MSTSRHIRSPILMIMLLAASLSSFVVIDNQAYSHLNFILRDFLITKDINSYIIKTHDNLRSIGLETLVTNTVPSLLSGIAIAIKSSIQLKRHLPLMKILIWTKVWFIYLALLPWNFNRSSQKIQLTLMKVK